MIQEVKKLSGFKNQETHHRIHTIPYLDPILDYFNEFDILRYYFWKRIFNSIFPFKPTPTKWPFPWEFAKDNQIYMLLLFRAP
jgi:hypothetical protein